MRVPKQHVNGLLVVARFSDDDVSRTLSALDDPKLHDIEQTAAALVKQTAFSSEEISQAINTAMSLANARADSGSSLRDFADELIHSIKEDPRKELHLEPHRETQLANNLSRLLADNGLVVASKSIYLRRDYEHTFCRARILTDIRPVFGEDPTPPPSAAIIIHALQLVYHEGSSTKEIHIALDGGDLSSLKLQIERAQDKAKSLKTLLTGAKVPTILE